MQIVTDNGSNYKKACELLIAEYPHIFWQPCAAHTINLMLKDIARFPEVDEVVISAKRICRFFYNTKRLHEKMRNTVGGELIRPNATRFGTVFIFLQSYFDKKDKFREWMVSADWRNSEWRNEPDFDYVENCLTSSKWWTDLKWVLDSVEPLYTMLRYADQQKNGTTSGFQLRMTNAIHMMEAHFGSGTDEFKKYMSKVAPRVSHLYTDTLLNAANVLDLEGHYKFKRSQSPDAADKLTRVISQIAESSQEAMMVMKQFLNFRANRGMFSGTMARLAASNMTASSWWLLYGGDVPLLQKYALRIVSQCVSSSGCERNWSTFALIHTTIRNRLCFEKLDDLVTVRYNLRLRIQQREIEREERELDAISIINDTALFQQDNPIMDWLNNSMSESSPVLDEDGGPSQIVIEEIRREKCNAEQAARWLAPPSDVITMPAPPRFEPPLIFAYKRNLVTPANLILPSFPIFPLSLNPSPPELFAVIV
uniref:Uncharacterized protein n=1 Tax=Avena sativa TaxID=4498 RepID=A0ACD6ANG4_AVESA